MNNSGSKESKTSIFDLKWNYNVKPSFIIAITKHKMIEDHPKFIKKIEKEAVAKTIRTIERMLKKGASMEKIRTSFGVAK